MTHPTPAEAAARIMERVAEDKPWPIEALPFADYRTCAPILAKAYLDATVPRDTRLGDWPEEGQEVWVWGSGWFAWTYLGHDKAHFIWLPAPPAPEDRDDD